MKKIIMMMGLVISLCFTIYGCGENNQFNRNPEGIDTENYQDNSEIEIMNPVVDWWKLYKGIDKRNCVTLQVTNPNNFPIQFSYDLVYYKNNEVVKTETKWAMTGIDSNKAGIIYGDIDIPSSNAVDRIELENVEVTKFEWKVLQGTFEKSFIDNGIQYFDVKFSDKPDHVEIWVVLYNDLNNDKKVQKNEFVGMGLLAPFVGIYETEGKIKIPLSSDLLNYTNYGIYSFALMRKD